MNAASSLSSSPTSPVWRHSGARSAAWGAHAPSRVVLGALAQDLGVALRGLAELGSRCPTPNASARSPKRTREGECRPQSALRAWLLVALGCAVNLAAHAQEPGSAISGIKGVKQEAVPSTRKIDPTAPLPPPPTVIPPPPGLNKVDGIDTIDGVKASGRAAIAPLPPPPPAALGSAASIQAVQGVSGLNTLKRENLEAALILKEGSPTPAGDGSEKGGKGKTAAASLLTAPLDKAPPKPGPKDDGRNGFQEFEKLNTTGS